MKIYKTQAEVEADIRNGVLAIEGDVEFKCRISIEASIIVKAGNIKAVDITARDITAGDITAGDITARDITAGDITARNITARDISYYAFCSVYENINCQSIVARREKANPPVCLDGKLEIVSKADDEVEKAIALLKSKGLVKDGMILDTTGRK